MAERLKERWRRFLGLHLTRPRRIVLDLLLAAVLLFIAWNWYGYPLPRSAEAIFRDLEQKNLVGEEELVLSWEKLPGRKRLQRITRNIYADLSEDRVAVGYMGGRGEFKAWAAQEPVLDPDTGEIVQESYRSVVIPGTWLEVFPRTEGVQVIPLSVLVPNENGDLGWAILVTGYPEGTMYGRLEITGEDGRPLDHILDTGNEKSLLFWTESIPNYMVQDKEYGLRDEDVDPPWSAGASYRLELMEAEGMLDSNQPPAPFLVQEGVLPEPA